MIKTQLKIVKAALTTGLIINNEAFLIYPSEFGLDLISEICIIAAIIIKIIPIVLTFYCYI